MALQDVAGLGRDPGVDVDRFEPPLRRQRQAAARWDWFDIMRGPGRDGVHQIVGAAAAQRQDAFDDRADDAVRRGRARRQADGHRADPAASAASAAPHRR